jgi:hypothetical protein
MVIAIEKQQKDAAAAVAEKAKQEEVAAKKKKELELTQKQIEENMRQEQQKRKNVYCPKVDRNLNSCFVEENSEKVQFWKVYCPGKDQENICFKKNDETYTKYDCEQGITFEEVADRAKKLEESIKQAAKNRQELNEKRKYKLCSVTKCPESSCYIDDLKGYDGYVELKCNGDDTKSACLKETKLDTIYDCNTMRPTRRIVSIDDVYTEVIAKAYVDNLYKGKKDCKREDNSFICGDTEYRFKQITD